MTDKQTPTDAELKAMWQLHAADIGGIFCYARAVLAKWGQPAQETKGRKVFVCTHCDGVYADQPVTRCDCLPDENTFTEGWICFGAPAQAAEPVAWAFKYDDGTWHDPSTTEHSSGMRPLFAAPQPVEREPLSDEEVDSLCKVGPVYAPDGKVTLTPRQYRYELESAQRYGLRKGERAHGIKGGQHG